MCAIQNENEPAKLSGNFPYDIRKSLTQEQASQADTIVTYLCEMGGIRRISLSPNVPEHENLIKVVPMRPEYDANIKAAAKEDITAWVKACMLFAGNIVISIRETDKFGSPITIEGIKFRDGNAAIIDPDDLKDNLVEYERTAKFASPDPMTTTYVKPGILI